ncbi:hypothetical protein [Bartonella sp. AP331QHHD]|uniref:hypothetical protein n=1 Tax=Bartonella sp. AP331QHHD TaxID=3243490 RepID=UPI0035CFB7C4
MFYGRANFNNHKIGKEITEAIFPLTIIDKTFSQALLKNQGNIPLRTLSEKS